MIQSIFLLFVGLFLIYIEFFLPGGVMGMAGSLIVIASIFFFAQTAGDMAQVILFIAVTIAGVAGVIKLALWRIKAKGSDNTIYLDADQEGYRSHSYDKELVGKKGTVATNMSPSGHIIIDGSRYQGVSQSGYLNKGVEVEVVATKGAYLTVKQTQQ